MSSVKPNVGTVVDLDGMQLPLRWDFGAVALFEEVSGTSLSPGLQIGARHLLYMLYAAIRADARHRGEQMPLGIEQLGSLLDSQEKVDRAMEALNQLILDFQGRDAAAAEPGKAEALGTETEMTPTGLPTPTSSPPSTSASPRTSSGDSRSVSSSSGMPAGGSLHNNAGGSMGA